MAIITYPLNGITYNAEDAETYLCTRTSGVYSAEDNFAAEISGERSVNIGPGLAWIKNDTFYGKSVCNTEAVTLAVPIASGTLGRIDRVVLRFDKAANGSEIVIKQGTPSGSPTPPAVQQDSVIYELGLYSINVPAGSVSINASDITDTRLDEAVCGLMRDGVTGIPTSTIYAQFSEFLDAIRSELAGIHSGTDIMLKSEYDPDNNGVVDLAEAVKCFIVQLPAAGWSGTGPYSQTVYLVGMTADWIPAWKTAEPQGETVDAAEITAQAGALALIQYMESAAGSLTFLCPDKKPEIDLVVRVGGALA